MKFIKKSTLLMVLGLSFISIAHAQQIVNQSSHRLNWKNGQSDKSVQDIPSFSGQGNDDAYPGLPVFITSFDVSEYGELTASIQNETYQPMDRFVNPLGFYPTENQPLVKATCAIARHQAVGNVEILPFRVNSATGNWERLVGFDLVVKNRPIPLDNTIGQRSPVTSALADGDIYKIKVTETGVYKLDVAFLESLGLDLNSINSSLIQIWGNEGGTLPEMNSATRPIDLTENAIFVSDGGDGKLNGSDFILFYAHGPDKWSWDSGANMFLYENNPYSNENYYYLKVGTQQGKRIAGRASLSGADYTTGNFDDLTHYEKDMTNLLDSAFSYPASGRIWLGEIFRYSNDQTFDFNFPNLDAGTPLRMRTRLAASATATSSYSVSVNNGTSVPVSISPISSGSYAAVARMATMDNDYTVNSANVSVRLKYNNPGGSAEGRLDYLTLNARCQLNMNGRNNLLFFTDKNTIGKTVAQYNISNAQSALKIWDVTDPYNVVEQQYSGSGNVSFGADATTLRKFTAFDGSNFMTPTAIGKIPNQNLHELEVPDMLVVYYPDFQAAANRLASHRAQKDNLSVKTVSITEVYNEFSSGRCDPSAIRDFARLLYEQNPRFRYLLLFGDGSFDYRGIKDNPANPVNSNFVPTYETLESLEPIGSFNTDDYFGLLDPTEGPYIGTSSDNGGMDISIGRFPVRTADEGEAMVDKMIFYEENPQTFADWKNKITFISDDVDKDYNIWHMDGNEDLAIYSDANYPLFNQTKLYADAFPQVSTTGGGRFPALTQAILSNLFNGSLVLNYMGHGGEGGWAQEQFFTTTEINNLANKKNLPLFITATCTFGPFDDPYNPISGGENLWLNPDGGAVAIMTTARVVYLSANEALTSAVFSKLLSKDANGHYYRLGEIMGYAKNQVLGANSRKFVLLGDPSMKLAIPEYGVTTSTVNGTVLCPTCEATINALQPVTITGFITLPDGITKATDFNGELNVTIFDKKKRVKTINNENIAPFREFDTQTNVVFKGSASVTNGEFSFSFITPKDIDYTLDFGKISYYAQDKVSREAAGYNKQLKVGGVYANAAADNKGPEVQVFMNNDQFAFGGITDNNPLLFVKISDENGINTAGSSIGHDITGLQDEALTPPQNYVLNDYYRSALNDYTQGEVRYPLYKLQDGRHTIRVKAWDTYNNSGEGYTEFVVASNANLALDHVLNYPNPFTTNTNFQFEHNFAGQPLDVQVQIFTVSGKLLKTINQQVTPDGYRVTDIGWNGTDDYGDNIGRGVYLYRISVRVENALGEQLQQSAYEKLVILK